MVYVSEKLRHSGDEAPRGVSFLPSDKNNLFLQPHKKYAVFFLLLCTPRGRFQAQRACFSFFKGRFQGSSPTHVTAQIPSSSPRLTSFFVRRGNVLSSGLVVLSLRCKPMRIGERTTKRRAETTPRRLRTMCFDEGQSGIPHFVIFRTPLYTKKFVLLSAVKLFTTFRVCRKTLRPRSSTDRTPLS